MYILVGTADFYAFNHYSSRLVTQQSGDPNSYYKSNADYYVSVDKSWSKSCVASWLIVRIKSKLSRVYYLIHYILASIRWIKTTFNMDKK